MEDLPAGVRDFVVKRLNSVEQVAVLILLAEAPGRDWSVADVSRELRSTEGAITRRLEDLRTAGVLASAPAAGRVRWEPASDDMAAAVRELIAAYRSRPNRVIELIYSKPPEAILAFAEAFKLKKEKP